MHTNMLWYPNNTYFSISWLFYTVSLILLFKIHQWALAHYNAKAISSECSTWLACYVYFFPHAENGLIRDHFSPLCSHFLIFITHSGQQFWLLMPHKSVQLVLLENTEVGGGQNIMLDVNIVDLRWRCSRWDSQEERWRRTDNDGWCIYFKFGSLLQI